MHVSITWSKIFEPYEFIEDVIKTWEWFSIYCYYSILESVKILILKNISILFLLQSIMKWMGSFMLFWRLEIIFGGIF